MCNSSQDFCEQKAGVTEAEASSVLWQILVGYYSGRTETRSFITPQMGKRGMAWRGEEGTLVVLTGQGQERSKIGMGCIHPSRCRMKVSPVQTTNPHKGSNPPLR